MKKYKVVVRPIMSFLSKLQSDTFFGAFCWSYKYLYGEAELERLLEKSMSQCPQIIFSNAFPSGYLPCPIGITDDARNSMDTSDKLKRRKTYQEDKKIKKCDMITLEAFKAIQCGNKSGFTEFLGKESVEQHSMMHNQISRDVGIVTKDENGGSLFSEMEYFAKEDTLYDIYIFTYIEDNILKNVLEHMFVLGIGANKSTGKGGFDIVSIEPCEELFENNRADANAYMALSNFIPSKNDPTEGDYQTIIKYGKLDREYAGSESPFKKPLMYIKAGSVFKTDDVKLYYGRCINGIAVNEKIVVNGCTIAVPMVM